MSKNKFRIIVTGCPKSGKSTLINALNQAQPSKPIFDFEETEGVYQLSHTDVQHLAVYEKLIGTFKNVSEAPDAIVAVMKASTLEDQLFLLSQLLDLRLPTIIILSFTKDLKSSGKMVNTTRLSAQLQVPVLDFNQTSADDILYALEQQLGKKSLRRNPHWNPSINLARAYNHMDSEWLSKHTSFYDGARLVEGLRLLADEKASEDYKTHLAAGALYRRLKEAREMFQESKEDWKRTELLQRGYWAGKIYEFAVDEVAIPQEKPWLANIDSKLLWWTLAISAGLLIVSSVIYILEYL